MATIETPSLDPFEPPPRPVLRFTVETYHRMIREGLFDDDACELLEGWIVPKMTRNPPHDVAIGLAQDALQGRIPEGWHLRAQSALTTAESEPEPDLAIVRGRRRDYLDRHPGPDDDVPIILDGREAGHVAVRDLLP